MRCRSSLIVWFSWSYSYLLWLSRGISMMTFTVSMSRWAPSNRVAASRLSPMVASGPREWTEARPTLETRRTPDEEVPMERVGVVGCGLMGSGIAEITARAGADVVVIELDRDAL